ncbi:hypothetical protein LNQ03_28955 [Klebsiella pneumoniae subsp. pneumoniae]|nr:hypothetical protein [Klebsiella pneumoniae subsp. pneumoniae]
MLKGTYPAGPAGAGPGAVGVPRFAPGDDALLRDNRCDFIGLNYYRRKRYLPSRLRCATGGRAWRGGIILFRA